MMTLFLHSLLTSARLTTQYLERPCGRKYGVPSVILSLIKSCHNGTTAVVRVSDSTTSDINIKNGLRQGCTMTPICILQQSLLVGAIVTVRRLGSL